MLLLVERAGQVVIVLEDLHWADQASLDLLLFLLRNLTAPGPLIVATSRTPLRLPGATVLRVPALTGEEIGRMLDTLGGDEAAEIAARSEGNPLFAEALADAGGATPASLRELLLAGAERLGPAALDLLRVAAVAGPRIPHPVLKAASGLDDLAFDDALRPVVRARLLVVDGDAYRFRHVLIRDAVHDDLLPGERIRLHARCAVADPANAATHWLAAGDPTRAYAAAVAEHRWSLALDLWPHAPAESAGERPDLLERAARSARHAESRTTQALAELPATDPRRARLLELRVAVRDQLGEDGLDDLRAAVRLAPRDARLLGALATTLAWNGQDDDARRHAERALALGDTRSLITLAALTGDPPTARRLFHQARTAPGTDIDTVLTAYAAEADVLEAAGEHHRAEAVARQGIERARQAGMARSRGSLLAANLAEPLASQGRWAESAEIIAAALALDPPPIYRAWLLMVQGNIAVWRGDLAEAGMVTEAPEGITTTGKVQRAYRATFEAECGGPWEAAIDAWRAVGQPYGLARALVRAATRGNGEHVREAVEIAGRLGAVPLSREARAVAAAGKVALGEAGPGLTARELEVLGLVAEGLSNRQIAERLFISARTAGVHLSNIMAKLGAASRVEAAATARRTGIV
ncbi:LuxR C-terminal-related transcriptional regulator [Nonomuraea sp. NBC_01738]|uniref:helix-turn-helix transcriptional regulator n=1 Tax=Nonomuraea sp. NBC_01738 TaxID=2976003 RepID=UPI002E1239B1|nr:LuxR C-terminal-related transcriptional regulator [Nonomuraea sp. NBC_01738]